jgi:hypothetical protein
MKSLQVVNAVATVSVLAAVLIFGTLLLNEMSQLQNQNNALPKKPAPLATPNGTRPSQPVQVKARLQVVRGLKTGIEYPLYQGQNFIGRTDEKPVDIDLEDQEAPDRIWSSRQHALITSENGAVVIEDLNSSNGTYVNRARIPVGQKKTLANDDLIQIGTVQLKVALGKP